MSNLKHSNFSADNRLEAMASNTYSGVRVDPLPITAGQEITVFYSGLLSENGADQVYLHTGYGNSKQWNKVQDHRMEKVGWGWAKVLPVEESGNLHICFHDSAQNWDNNTGTNWTFQVHNG
ncbi:carbohydrate-binding protein [Heliorestis acidaminivorans]